MVVSPLVTDLIVKLILITKVHALSMGYSGFFGSPWTYRNLYLCRDHTWSIRPRISRRFRRFDSIITSIPPYHSIGKGKSKWNNHFRCQNAYPSSFKSSNPWAKEGLALINGTQFILSYAVLGLSRFYNCLKAADCWCYVLRGSTRFYLPAQERIT